MAQNSTSSFDTSELGEDFKNALRLANQVGSTPSSFSSVTRFLLSDHAKKAAGFSPPTKSALQRLLKGQSILAALYFAARLFKGSDLESNKSLSALGLANLFKMDELAAILAATYLARRMRAICEAEEWQYVSKHLELHANLGAFLGVECRALGLANGVMIGALPSIALGSFHKNDVKGFKEYRRVLKNGGIAYDHGHEKKKWQCTSIQIAAGFVQLLGLGLELAKALGHLEQEGEQQNGSELESQLRAAHMCIQGLAAKGKVPPDGKALECLDLSDSSIDRLEAKAKEINSTPEPFRWIERLKEDLTPESAPQLFVGQSAAAEKAAPQEPAAQEPSAELSADQPQVYTYETLPPDVQAVISKEDFDSMSQEEIAQLIRETVYNPAKGEG